MIVFEKSRMSFIFFLMLILNLGMMLPYRAIGKQGTYPHYSWGFKGIFGAYDKASVQRGYQVYRQRCASCHSIRAMRYADLQQMGLTLEQIDKIARQDHVLDGRNAQGQDVYRPATVEDFLASPYLNEAMAKAANDGHLPVDFSRYLMVEPDGENHVMAFLMGYRPTPTGFQFNQGGKYYNLYAPFYQTVMKPPLIENGIRYGDGVTASLEQQARDVVTFLSWTAHPHLVERHRAGIMIFLYMGFITILVFLVNRRLWLGRD